MSVAADAMQRQLLVDTIEHKILMSTIPVTTAQIVASTGATDTAIRKALRELTVAGRIREVATGSYHKAWEWLGNRESQTTAPPRRIQVMKTPDYDPQPWSIEAARPSAADHERHGSRIGDWIHYRNGTKKHISET